MNFFKETFSCCIISTRKKAVVATILVSSLLQLQRTHWLKDNWAKEDILVMTKDDKVLFEQLYMSQESVSTKKPAASNTQAEITVMNCKLPSFRPKTSLECLIRHSVPIKRLQDNVRLRPQAISHEHGKRPEHRTHCFRIR
jgi:hypothetical protein